MHNEELGLLKKEIMLLWNSLSKIEKTKVDQRISAMPVVPNFPKISISLDKAGSFKAKHWITISKYIVCTVWGMCY